MTTAITEEPKTPVAAAPADSATPTTETPAAPITPAAVTPEPRSEPGTQEGQKPHAPETYELTLPAEHAHLTDVDLAFIKTEAKALGLTNAQAQSLVEARNGLLVEQSTQFLTESKADTEIGGDKWDTTVKHAQAGVAFLFPDATDAATVREWFNNTGLGNHKVFLKAMARLGKARAEDTPITGNLTPEPERKETKDVLFPKSTSDFAKNK